MCVAGCVQVRVYMRKVRRYEEQKNVMRCVVSSSSHAVEEIVIYSELKLEMPANIQSR